jgi:propanol-preferring alcohol dehydrogenase
MARAVQLQQAREALHLVEGDAPAPAPGEALVRVEACALGQLDWNLLTLDAPPRLPLVPGHEAVGVVEASGVGGQLPVGTRVLVTPIAAFCGACPACKAGEPRRCWDVRWRGMHADGALRTHLAVDERALVPLPEAARSLKAEHLALVGGSLWTAVGAVRSLGLVRPSRVAVLGVGGVGHLVVQVLRALGHEVLAADVDPDRVRLARELGAEPLEGHADAAVVCTPSTQAVQRAVRSVKAGARLALVGTSPTGRLDVAVADLVWRQLVLAGGLLGTQGDLGEALALLADGRVVPRVEVAPLADAPARLWSLRDLGFGGRLVFVP